MFCVQIMVCQSSRLLSLFLIWPHSFKRAGGLENHDGFKHNGLRPSFTGGKHRVMAEFPSDLLISTDDVSAAMRDGVSLTLATGLGYTCSNGNRVLLLLAVLFKLP